MATIEIQNLSKYYHVDHPWKHPKDKRREIGVEKVNLTIKQGEFVFVIGSCGAGKSTLLNLIAGRTKPHSGCVLIDGERIKRLRPWNRKKKSLQIGYVSQKHNMDRSKMIVELLEDDARAGFKKFGDRHDCEKRIQKVLGLTGLSGTELKYPIELTYGQRRRVELARALINSPPILVLDEITAGLDADSMWDVFLLLEEINQMGITIVMATHSSFYVNMSRRRVITLVHGNVYGDEKRGRYGEVRPQSIVK